MLTDQRVVDECRICRSLDLYVALSLGTTPLANSLVAPGSPVPDPSYPLEVLRCRACGLLQLSVVVDPEVMFRNYLYASSASTPLLVHFDALAAEVVERFAPAGSFVVEAGSNDGVLLSALAKRGVRPLGIEPATNLAEVATRSGLETWNEFFGSNVARRLVAQRGRARAVLANNVLAHIDDVRDVLAALDAVLDEDGVFVAEVPYLGDLIEHVEYDTIYHEHLSYFAVGPLRTLFEGAGLELFDVRRLAIHGGSIRLFVGRRGRHPVLRAVEALREHEHAAGLHLDATYERFAERVAASRTAIRELLLRLRSEGRSVSGLGATAKGNTLLNYCGIGTELVRFITDTTPMKQGLETPGMRIPIRSERAILEDRTDYILLLAWNYAEAIIARNQEYLARGGQFIHPIPLARIVA